MNKIKIKQHWFPNEGMDRANQYLSKRSMLSGSISTLRKLKKAHRIAGKSIYVPKDN